MCATTKCLLFCLALSRANTKKMHSMRKFCPGRMLAIQLCVKPPTTYFNFLLLWLKKTYLNNGHDVIIGSRSETNLYHKKTNFTLFNLQLGAPLPDLPITHFTPQKSTQTFTTNKKSGRKKRVHWPQRNAPDSHATDE